MILSIHTSLPLVTSHFVGPLGKEIFLIPGTIIQNGVNATTSPKHGGGYVPGEGMPYTDKTQYRQQGQSARYSSQPYTEGGPKYVFYECEMGVFPMRDGRRYDSSQTHRHQDSMARIWNGVVDDRYLSPYDGHVSKLVVQTTDEIYDNPGNSTYRRTYIRNISPSKLRLAHWPTSHIDYVSGKSQSGDIAWVIAKWIPAALALTIMLLEPESGAQVRNGGNYDTFPYKYYGYAKVARNAFENDSPGKLIHDVGDEVNPVCKRALRPRYLCFLRNPDDQNGLHGVMPMMVEEWIAQYKSERNLEYLFVAYTAEQFKGESNEDMEALHKIAETATRAAGLPAYWIGCSCMPDDHEMEEDVFRISDVVRGAKSVIIAVGPPVNDAGDDITTTHEMLQQWGQRLWTFPEVLLSPAGQPIKVYTRGQDLQSPLALPKNQFAARVWSDALVARQLVDHFEGNLGLSRLELVILALQCLHSRNTTQYLKGDHSYALMGLLRLRPYVDQTDTAFQAFARLSLANDSDMLLERLICTLPKDPGQHWSCMDDAWNVNLWDIYPTCQIAGVGHDDTVIIDGAFGANVRWKSFAPVANLRRTSWKRLFVQVFLHSSPIFFFFSLALLALNLAAAAILLIYSLAMIGASPKLLRVIYGGKFWYTQPWFFGFEGYLDIETIERQIFGARLGRLEWSAWGSPLSRHHANAYGECVGSDPTSDPKVRQMVAMAKHAKPGEQRIFTLVDTNTMEVTLFRAVRPPVAFLLCGHEGGMQRAVGVSYDWTTGTCYRETVLRMETPVLEKMDRVSRLRLGLKRPGVD
ncbi:hypothetical protein B0A49_08340, partial [Cryomyces minteri]